MHSVRSNPFWNIGNGCLPACQGWSVHLCASKVRGAWSSSSMGSSTGSFRQRSACPEVASWSCELSSLPELQAKRILINDVCEHAHFSFTSKNPASQQGRDPTLHHVISSKTPVSSDCQSCRWHSRIAPVFISVSCVRTSPTSPHGL